MAEKADVRPVMENFINYELEKAAGGITSRTAETTPKNTTAKFIQGIENRDQWDCFSSRDVSLESELESLDEDCDGAGLTSRVPAFKPQKKALLDSSKTKANAILKFEARVDDDVSTDESADGIVARPETNTTAGGTSEICKEITMKIPLEALFITELSCVFEKLPVMTPKSQYHILSSSPRIGFA